MLIVQRMVISPELADVLSIVLLRVRDQDGAVPLVAAYDRYERVWMPPMPLIFQRRIGIENRPAGIDGFAGCSTSPWPPPGWPMPAACPSRSLPTISGESSRPRRS